MAITACGEQAERWLEIAQAFAGTPGTGREPGQFDTAEREGNWR